MSEKFINKTQLKTERGWTEGLIKKFAPEPDRIREYRYYGRSSEEYLYLLNRIEAIEITPYFQLCCEKVKARRASAQLAIETKKEKLSNWIDGLDITVPRFGRKRLTEQACDSYNSLHFDADKFASPNSDPKFLQRIMVNFLRHEMTDYENHLDTIYGKVGVDDARDSIRRRVYDAIAESYPDLADECYRQHDARLFQALIPA